MELPRDGQEYAHIDFTDLPFNVPVEVSIDERETWAATTAGDTVNQRKILLRGPDSVTTEGVLIAHDTRLWVRVVDTPETVVRAAGLISLY